MSKIGGKNGASEKSNSEYSSNYVSLDVDLPNENSTFIYEIEITNFGSISQGILSIKGYPDNLKITPINYDLNSKICSASECINNFKKTIQFEIAYKDYGFNVDETRYDFNIEFVFKPFKKVEYTGFEDTWTFSKEIIEGGNFRFNYTLHENQYFKIYSGSRLLTEGEYTYSNNVLKIDNVSDNLRIERHYTNILRENEFIGSISGYGITVTAHSDGVYSIDGTSTEEVFVRLSDCIIISNTATKSDLIPVEYPTSTPILEAGKYYNIDFEEISGEKPSEIKYNTVRFTFRKLNSLDGYQLFGYDFSSGMMEATTVPLADDLGMYSLFISPNLTFDNYKFKVNIYEIFPDDQSNIDGLETTITGCGSMMVSFFENNYIEVNGYAANTCFVDLDSRVIQEKVAFNTSGYPVKYNANDMVKINYEYISGYPQTNYEIAFALRKKMETSTALTFPKLSSYSYDLTSSLYVEGVVSEDVAMFSMFVQAGVSFNHYRFRVTSEK